MTNHGHLLSVAILLGSALPAVVTGAPESEAAPGESPARVGNPGRLPFAPGETLTFAVKYGMVRAGNAVMAVEDAQTVQGEPAYRFVSTAHSSRFFSTFFQVEDRVESVWSIQRRLPLRFEKRIREGSYTKDVTVRFDHTSNLAIYQDGREEEIIPGAQDVLSAFYMVRAQPMGIGDIINVPNHADGKNYDLQVRVLRREEIEVEGGRFRCVVIEPLLRTAGLFKQEGRLTIWLTDDSRRMPVLMKSKVAVGSIVAELESFRMGRPPAWKGQAPPALEGTAGGSLSENHAP